MDRLCRKERRAKTIEDEMTAGDKIRSGTLKGLLTAQGKGADLKAWMQLRERNARMREQVVSFHSGR